MAHWVPLTGVRCGLSTPWLQLRALDWGKETGNLSQVTGFGIRST